MRTLCWYSYEAYSMYSLRIVLNVLSPFSLVNPFANELLSLSVRRDKTSFTLFCRYYFGKCRFCLTKVLPSPKSSPKILAEPIYWCVNMSISNAYVLKVALKVSLFAPLWNHLPSSYFPAQHDLDSFKRCLTMFFKSGFLVLYVLSFFICNSGEDPFVVTFYVDVLVVLLSN